MKAHITETIKNNVIGMSNKMWQRTTRHKQTTDYWNPEIEQSRWAKHLANIENKCIVHKMAVREIDYQV